MITIGSDPEFVVVNKFTEKPTSVIGKLGGKKGSPKEIAEGFGVEEDNVMAEATIPPCTTREEFIHNIEFVKTKINEILDPHDLKVKSASSARYTYEELNNHVAQKFGCEPSYCIYTGKVSPRPKAEDVGNIRSAGTHIHVGFEKMLSLSAIDRFIHAMDMFLGVPSLLIDTDTERRNLYGNAGDMRFRNIMANDDVISVVEYRTLGGYMTSSPELIGWMYDQTMKAVDYFKNNEYDINNNIRDIIDQNNIDEAVAFCNKLEITIPELNITTVHV